MTLLTLFHLVVSGIFVAYNLYVFRYVLKKRSYYKIKHARMFLHTLSGIVTMVLGTIGLVSLLLRRKNPPLVFVFVHIWSLAFLLNNITGWVLIPKLTCADPATKREFISLFLVQVIFCPFVYGIVYPEWRSTMQVVSALLIVAGAFTSGINLFLYLIDWYESTSQKIVSGKSLVKQMEKEGEHGDWWSHYVSILFKRGSSQTRMPANKRMIGVAFTIVLPFVLLAFLVSRMDAISTHKIYTENYQWYTLLLFGTIGNTQVFHGTMSVRGIDKVHRTTNMVLGTTLLEVVTLLTVLLQDHTLSECLEYASSVAFS